MQTIPPFNLPLPPRPPAGYGWEQRDTATLSIRTAFKTGVNRWDVFFGRHRCIICGLPDERLLHHCHIVGHREAEVWENLIEREWIPEEVKHHPGLEPRNGVLMCSNHHNDFDAFRFFIRFGLTIQKFIFVNFSVSDSLAPYHGRAIALDMKDHLAPFPSLFIIHEQRVRGFNPFAPAAPQMPHQQIPWQQWMTAAPTVVNQPQGSPQTFTFNRARG